MVGEKKKKKEKGSSPKPFGNQALELYISQRTKIKSWDESKENITKKEEQLMKFVKLRQTESVEDYVMWADTAVQNTTVAKSFLAKHKLEARNISPRRITLADGHEAILYQKAVAA